MALPYRPVPFLKVCINLHRQFFFLRTSLYHSASQCFSIQPYVSVKQESLLTCRLNIPILQPCSYFWSIWRSYAKKGKDKGGKGHKKVVLTQEQLNGLVNLEEVTGEYDSVIEDLKDKFIHQLSVRTSQGVFDNLVIKTPDGNFPLIQLGQVIQKSAQLLAINLASSPQYITHVKTALEESGMNINPQQDGTSLFVPIPNWSAEVDGKSWSVFLYDWAAGLQQYMRVTREHRESLAKNAKSLSEKSKKQIRDIYSKYSKKIKSSKEGHAADVLIAADDMVQDLMHEKLNKIDEITAAKQQELLGGK